MPLDWRHLREIETEDVSDRDEGEKDYKGDSYVNYKRRPVSFYQGSNFRKTNTKRLLSAEIEVDNIRNFQATDEACHKWQASIVDDGSLGENGFEINTAPASGNKFIEQIVDITSGLKKGQFTLTRACGLHVHIDARDYDFDDLIKLVHLYAKIEDGLYSVISTSRRTNSYCKKCGIDLLDDVNRYTGMSPSDYEEIVAQTLYKRDKSAIKDVKRYKDAGNRYRAINLHSFIYRGSVECRLHQGTCSALKIINWACLWGIILDYAKNHTNMDFSHLSSNSFDALLEVTRIQRLCRWLCDRRDHFIRNGS